MQSLHFGSIENLTIRSSEPVFHPAPAIMREIKLGSEDAPAHHGADDFLLKRQVVELIEELTGLGDGIVSLIEVKHGLPFRVFLRTTAA